jgi:hypothetical protein
MKKPVISSANLPTTLPISWTLVGFLLLEKFSAPTWVWFAALWVYLIVWVVTIIRLRKEEQIEVFNSQEEQHLKEEGATRIVGGFLIKEGFDVSTLTDQASIDAAVAAGNVKIIQNTEV